MSSSSAANSLGLGIGLAVGAAASAAAAAVWYALPAAGADASSEARTLARALRRRALELGVPAADMAAAEDMGGTDGLAALVQAVQSARDPPRDGRGAAAAATQRQGLRDELAGLVGIWIYASRDASNSQRVGRLQHSAGTVAPCGAIATAW